MDLQDLLTATTFDADLLKEINITDSNVSTADGNLIIRIKAGNSNAYDGVVAGVMINAGSTAATVTL